MSRRDRECKRDGCEETRFSQIGMDLHLLTDHGLTVEVEP
jgi:hypothetical protein